MKNYFNFALRRKVSLPRKTIAVLCISGLLRLLLLFIVSWQSGLIDHLYWPARYPKDITQYEGLIAPQLQEDIDNGAEAGESTDPDRFDDDDLLQRESIYGT